MRQPFAQPMAGASDRRPGRLWHLVCVMAACLVLAANASADPLTEGAALFDNGSFAEAANTFEATEGDTAPSDLLKYNAGVAYLSDGKFDEGVKRLEDVAVRAGGDLRRAALFNLGHAWFQNAHAMAQTTEEDAKDQDPIEILTQAAVRYRTAVDFYRMIRPEDDETRQNITVAKTALRAVVDRIAQIEESRRKEADQDALKEPAKLLFDLMGQQRLYRAIAWALEEEPQRYARLASRRLRRSVAEVRDRAEMLRRYLAEYSGEPADASGPDPSAPQADNDMVARHRQAAIPLGESIDIQANVEGSLAELDFAKASQQHTDAIRKMRDAIPSLPLDLGLVLGDALRVAPQNLAATQARVESATSQPTATSQPSGTDDLYANVVGDDLLAPVARVVSPNDLAQAQRLADTQEDVVWSTAILTQVQAPEPPAIDPNAPAQPAGQLDAETIEKIRTLAQQANQAATQAHTDLQAGHVAESVDDQEACVQALRDIADLLPKPPKSPADTIREILQRQQAVRQGIDSLADMTDGRDDARRAMAQAQTADAQQARDLATQLQAAQDENQRNAGTLTGQAGEQLDQSSQSLNDDRTDAAAEQTDRAIETLTKALDALSGKNDDQDKSGQQQNQQQQQQDQKQQDQQQQNQGGQGYQLTPRQARMMMEELDRKRREEEKAILPADSGITVTKDW